MADIRDYLERFPNTPKKNKSKRKASTDKVENFLFEFEKLLEDLGDDSISSDGSGFIEDVCKDYEHCRSCYGKIIESYEFDELVKNCNCSAKYRNTKENYI